MKRTSLIIVLGLVASGCSSKSQSPMDQARDAFINARWDEAIDHCTRIVRSDSDNADAWMLRGRSYLGKQSAKKAAEDFTKAIVLRGEEPSGYYFRARAYRALDRHQLAEADIVRGHQLDPEYKRFKALGYFSLDAAPDAVILSSDQKNEREKRDDDRDTDDGNSFAILDEEAEPIAKPKAQPGNVERGGVAWSTDQGSDSEDQPAGQWNRRLQRPSLTQTRKLAPGRQLASLKATPGGRSAKEKDATGREAPKRGAGNLLNRRLADVLKLDQPDQLPRFQPSPREPGKGERDRKTNLAEEPTRRNQREPDEEGSDTEATRQEDSEQSEDAPRRRRRTRRIPNGTFHFSNNLQSPPPPMTGISSMVNSPSNRSLANQRRRRNARTAADRLRESPLRERPARFQWPPRVDAPRDTSEGDENLSIWNYSVPFPLLNNPPTTGTFTNRSTLPDN